MAKNSILMKFGLDSSGVKAGLANAKTSIANFAKGANEKLGQVAKLVSVGLTAAFVGFAKKALTMGTTLSDIAASTGFATEEFQVFRGALIDAGGKAESMEKGINNMQKAIVQGAEGMTTYTRAFERLGLSVDDLRRMTPEEQFKTIAKAVAEADDQQGAYTSSMEIFGTKVAPRMREVFDRLAKDGYQKMAKDVEESYGIMDSTTQASLDKAADSVERFKNKATIYVGELISGEANFAAIKALGYRVLEMLAKVGEGILNSIRGGIINVVSLLAANFTMIWENVKKAVVLVGLEGAKALAPIFNQLADVLNKIGFDIQKWDTSAIQNEIDKIQFENPQKRMGELWDEYHDGLEDLIPPIEGASKAAGETAETYERIAKNAGKVEEQLKKNKEAEEKAAAAAQQGQEKITAEKRAQQKLADAMRRGDDDAIKLWTEELEILKRVAKVKKETGLDDDEARAHVERMIAKEKEQHDAKMRQEAEEKAALEKRKQQELDILRAQADGNDALAAQLQMRVDKEQEAIDLMNEFNISLEEATALAAKLAAMRAGPDLNQSGIVTPREQAQWEAQQKERQKQADAQLAQEMQDEREIGNRWRNVTEERRNAPTSAQKALQRKSDAERKRENAAIGEMQRRVDRGRATKDDLTNLQAAIAAKRAARDKQMDIQKQIDATRDNAERDRLRQEQKDRASEAAEIAERLKNGDIEGAKALQDIFDREQKQRDLQKQIDDAKAAGDDKRADDLQKEKDALDPGGPGGPGEQPDGKPGDGPDKKPNEPKPATTDDVVAAIKDNGTKLEDIKKLLTC